MSGCEFLLVRHASCERQGCFLGHSDVGLGSAAAAQLAALAPTIAGLQIDRVISSDLRRCRETASRLVPDRPIRYDPAWREFDSGLWTLESHEELLAGPAAARYQAWLDDPTALTPPGGERLVDFQRRITAAADALADSHAGERILLISHAGPIQHLLTTADPGLDPVDAQPPPASLRPCRWPPIGDGQEEERSA